MARCFVSYGIDCPDVAQRYIAALEGLPSMRAWMADALAERQYIPWEEPYRDGR
jgi:glutathione S-transferase